MAANSPPRSADGPACSITLDQLLDDFRTTADFEAFRSSATNEATSEQRYIAHMTSILERRDVPYRQAGSHSPKDLTLWPDTVHEVVTEWKKMDKTWKIMCNETLPTRGVQYVLIHTKEQAVEVVDGEDIIRYDHNKNPTVSPEAHLRSAYEYHAAVQRLREHFRRNSSYHAHTRTNHSFDVRNHFLPRIREASRRRRQRYAWLRQTRKNRRTLHKARLRTAGNHRDLVER